MSRSFNDGKYRKSRGYELWAPRPGQGHERSEPLYRREERRRVKRPQRTAKFRYDWFGD